MILEYSLAQAQKQDLSCPLSRFRSEFVFPQKNGKDMRYFTGNSLGLQSKAARVAVETHLDKWGSEAVDGHFEGDNKWYTLHQQSKKGFAYLLGAKESEVSVMNGLSTNLHLMLASFYQKSGNRTKIIIEEKAFPSDYYVVESFLRLQGLNPEEHLLEIPYSHGKLFSTKNTIDYVREHATETALLMLGGVNYYSGQVLDMEEISSVAADLGICIGWDLAHAAGNIDLKLHDWNVDFAAWCTYKYLNSGPGAPSGIFVHEKHHQKNLPRMAGWWGYDAQTRFAMEKKFKPMPGADGWQQSNGPVIAMAPISASLAYFMDAGKEALFEKRRQLTQYFIDGLIRIKADLNWTELEIITPLDPNERGSQISVYVDHMAKDLFEFLYKKNILPDYRKPDVIRFAPVPLYNNFEDIFITLEAIRSFYQNSLGE